MTAEECLYNAQRKGGAVMSDVINIEILCRYEVHVFGFLTLDLVCFQMLMKSITIVGMCDGLKN